MSEKTYALQNRTRPEIVERRKVLYDLYERSPLPIDELLVNLGLYMRSGALARLLFLNEIYESILQLPGCVVEFGTWWGQSLVLFENLRAVHEPYNYTRRIIGFDTFEGYRDPGDRDKRSETIKRGGYATSRSYETYLDELLDYHQSENVMGHIRKHRLVTGDATQTAPKYFAEHPEDVVALAFFDMALYEPTKKCIEAIMPRLMKGSVVAFDEFGATDYPGETEAVMETLGLRKHTVRRSRFLPDRAYYIIDGA